MRFVLFAIVFVVVVSACGSSPDGGNTTDAGNADAPEMVDAPTVPLTLPPVNAKFDYQLGGPYAPPMGVQIVLRAANTTPAQGLYNICYVNGFQVRAVDDSFWVDEHPDLVLRDGNGDFVVDPASNEKLLDIRLAEKRSAIASLIAPRILECAQNGYQAIEINNLDSYTRSQGLLNEQQAVYLMKMYADQAHKLGRPIAQKNAPALAARKAELGSDFAIATECNRNGDCGMYTAGYGDHVIMIEHREQDFAAGCGAYPNVSIVLRDPSFVTPEDAAYLYDGC